MRKASIVAVVAILSIATACQKTGEGEYQVQTPDVDISTDTSTLRTPTVDAGMTKDTVVISKPTVDVNTPAERRDPNTATPNRRP